MQGYRLYVMVGNSLILQIRKALELISGSSSSKEEEEKKEDKKEENEESKEKEETKAQTSKTQLKGVSSSLLERVRMVSHQSLMYNDRYFMGEKFRLYPDCKPVPLPFKFFTF